MNGSLPFPVRVISSPHPYSSDEQPLPACRRILFFLLLPLLPAYAMFVLARLAAFVMLLLFMAVTCAVSTLGAPGGEPLRGLRRYASKAIVGLLARGCLACVGVWPGMLNVRGRWDPTCPVAVCAPHVGMTDGLIWMTLGFPRPVILEAYTKIPVVASILSACGALPVPIASASTSAQDRRAHASSPAHTDASGADLGAAPASGATFAAVTGNGAPVSVRPSATAAIRQKILEHKRSFVPEVDDAPIVLFPEGITHNGRAILTFFPGAFEGGSKVQPVVIRHRFRYFHGHSFLSTLPAHLARLLLNPWMYVSVEFLPVLARTPARPSRRPPASALTLLTPMCLDSCRPCSPLTHTIAPVPRRQAMVPTPQQAADGKLLAQATREVMAGATGVPLHEIGNRELRAEAKAAAQAKKDRAV